MIHIYIESGIKRSAKGTTNEYDFIEKFISLHFPNREMGVDYQIQGWDGKDHWYAYQPIFQQQTDRGDKNILIFDADRSENPLFSPCSGADAYCGGALVPCLHRGYGVLAGVYGFRPAGGLRLFCGAAYRVYRGSGAGVPGFPLWAPGHRVLAAGSSVRGKIRLAGFYGELMTSGHFVQKCRAAGKNPAARFSFMGRR